MMNFVVVIFFDILEFILIFESFFFVNLFKLFILSIKVFN